MTLTPRGHSSISDAVDFELQILPTERENITCLLCTKGRRTRGIRRDWRREFFYDEESFTISPLHEDDQSKTTLVARLNEVKETLKLSNCALARALDVHEKSIRRWLSGECLPTEMRIPKIMEILKELDRRAIDEPKNDEAENSSMPETSYRRATSDATHPIKENDIGVDNVNNESVEKAKKKTKSAKHSAISIDDPCSSCPANKEKEMRFVDGEGGVMNQWTVVALKR